MVDVCTFLRDGAKPLVTMPARQDWRPIVHRDMHLGNLFVRPSTAGDGCEGVDVIEIPFEPTIMVREFDDDKVSRQFDPMAILADRISTPKSF